MSVDAETAAWFKEVIGPRKVGGRYYSHCSGCEYTVLNIETNRPTWPIWQITIRWEDADRRVVKHCTAWDPDWDRVVS